LLLSRRLGGSSDEVRRAVSDECRVTSGEAEKNP
jgi:hypothetical protein